MHERSLLPPLILERFPWLLEEGDVWLVGGALRDYFLNRSTNDLDFVVAGDARQVARKVADTLTADYFELDKRRGTGRVLSFEEDGTKWTLDFAALRAKDIRADLRARDFTVNALAISMAEPGKLIDPMGGLKDIKDNVLRVCGPSSIVDDPIRGLRAVRLATQLDFRIDTQTLALLKEAAPDLTTASPERIRDELFQMLAASRPAKHVRRLIRLRLLQQFCPEVPLLEDIPSHSLQARNELERTLAVMDWLSRLLSVLGSRHDPEAAADMTLAQATVRLGRFRDQMEEHLAHALSADRTARQLLFFAALYHAAESRAQILQADTDKAPSEEVHEARATVAGLRAKALRLSRAEVERVGAVVSNQSLPAQLASQAGITPKSIYRFFRQTGRAGVEVSLLFLAKFLADHIPPPPQELWARQVEMARVVLLAYFEDRGRRVSPPPLIRGDELSKELAVEPGPVLGQILEMIREAQASDEIHEKSEALKLARRILEKGLDSPEAPWERA